VEERGDEEEKGKEEEGKEGNGSSVGLLFVVFLCGV
jgi:hypothetical protein